MTNTYYAKKWKYCKNIQFTNKKKRRALDSIQTTICPLPLNKKNLGSPSMSLFTSLTKTPFAHVLSTSTYFEQSPMPWGGQIQTPLISNRHPPHWSLIDHCTIHWVIWKPPHWWSWLWDHQSCIEFEPSDSMVQLMDQSWNKP